MNFGNLTQPAFHTGSRIERQDTKYHAGATPDETIVELEDIEAALIAGPAARPSDESDDEGAGSPQLAQAIASRGGNLTVAAQLAQSGADPGAVKKCLVLAFELASSAFATGVSFGAVGTARSSFIASMLVIANADRSPDMRIQRGDAAYFAIEAFGNAVFAIGGTALIGALNGTGGALSALLRDLIHRSTPGGFPRIDNPRAVVQGDAFILTFSAAAGTAQAYATYSAIDASRGGHPLPVRTAASSFNSLPAASPAIATMLGVAAGIGFAMRRDGALRYSNPPGFNLASARRLIVSRLQSAHQIGLTGRFPLVPVPIPVAQIALPIIVQALVDLDAPPAVIASLSGIGQAAVFTTLLDVWGTQTRRNDAGTRGIDVQLAEPNIDRGTRAQLLMERSAAVHNHVTEWDPFGAAERLLTEGFRNASVAAIAGFSMLSALEQPMAIPRRQASDAEGASWQGTVVAAVFAVVMVAILQRLASMLVGDAGRPYEPVSRARGGAPETLPSGDPAARPGRGRSAGVGVLTSAMGGAAAVVLGDRAGTALTGRSLALASLAGAVAYGAVASVSPLAPASADFQPAPLDRDQIEAEMLASRERADPEVMRPRHLFEQAAYYASVLVGGPTEAAALRAQPPRAQTESQSVDLPPLAPPASD